MGISTSGVVQVFNRVSSPSTCARVSVSGSVQELAQARCKNPHIAHNNRPNMTDTTKMIDPVLSLVRLINATDESKRRCTCWKYVEFLRVVTVKKKKVPISWRPNPRISRKEW